MSESDGEKRTIMAIGGHIGDMELTCGGVLATRTRYAQAFDVPPMSRRRVVDEL